MHKLIGCLAIVLATACAARAGDDLIFDPSSGNPAEFSENGVAGPVFSNGFKKLPGDDALNQWSVEVEAGAFEQRASSISASQWKNLYLAFAVDVRYARDCFGSKTSVLCTFLHSGVSVSGNLNWNDSQSAARYTVVLVPVEYITGTFGKGGLDLKTANGALYAAIGTRAEFVRDLGLDVQNRILGALSASLNYASQQQALGTSLAFHWIGSVRVFAGGSAVEMTGQSGQGTFSGGVETQLGLALDLANGSVSFTNTTRLEGDVGFGQAGARTGFTTERVELKYLHAVCRAEKRGGCNAPRVLNYGGGVRYEYLTSSYEGTSANTTYDRSIHRLVFFAEIARF